MAWAQGGFLGVELFFVLSGFLITSLLVAEWSGTSRIRLTQFWIRRARRLLPALFVLVLVIGVYYMLVGFRQPMPGLRANAFATLMYVGNWHQIATGSNYFVATGPLSPLQHTWSLAIEEQFYLVWPLLLVAVFWLVKRSTKATPQIESHALRAVLIVTATGALASALDMALLYAGGRGLERTYYGTDTRATGLLTGATVAIATALYGQRITAALATIRYHSRLLVATALLSLTGLVVAMGCASGQSSWLFPWGMLGVDLAIATVILCVTVLPGSPVTKLFSVRPVCVIGLMSYGVYLWHLPCFLWLDERVTGLHGAALFMLRVVVTFAVASVSYVVIEQPIRQRRLPTRLVRVLLPVASAGTVAAVLTAGAAAGRVPGGTFAPVAHSVAVRYAGGSQSCEVHLGATKLYRTAPLPPAQTGGYIFHWILKHQVDWSGGGYPNSAVLRFHTCPARRVLLIGDSIAFTAGVPMLHREDDYGVELANAAVLGCAFGTRGTIKISGAYTHLPAQCATVLQRWRRAEEQFHSEVVVVELGYRDEFDWSWGHHLVHLGQRDFDAYVRAQVLRFVRVLGQDGTRILFLTVPYVQPPALPNGDPAPAGSTARHDTINAILKSVALSEPSRVRVLDIDKIVSPQNRYTQNVHGNPCRFDGIHFTVYCASLLQPYVLTAARSLMVPEPNYGGGRN